MITVTLISTFLSFSLLSSTEAVDELRRDYGEVRGTLQVYHGLLRDRIDPSPALALSNTLLSAGFIAGIHSESRGPPTSSSSVKVHPAWPPSPNLASVSGCRVTLK